MFKLLFRLGVFDTLSDSIQCLPKNDSFNIRFNIALPKIHFKILFNSKKFFSFTLQQWQPIPSLIQFNFEFFQKMIHSIFDSILLYPRFIKLKKSADSIQKIIQFNSQGLFDTGRIGKVPENCPKSVQNRQKRGLFIKNGKY